MRGEAERTAAVQDGRALAIRIMRRALADHAAARLSQPRAGSGAAIDPRDRRRFERLIEIDRALAELLAERPRQAQVFEYRYFGCLGPDETARALGISPHAAHRELHAARTWLATRLARRRVRGTRH